MLAQGHELHRFGSLLPLVHWLAFCLPNYVTMIYNNNNQSCYKVLPSHEGKVKSSLKSLDLKSKSRTGHAKKKKNCNAWPLMASVVSHTA